MRGRFKMSWVLTAAFTLIVAVLSYLGDRFLGVPYWIGFFNPTDDQIDRKS